MNIFCIILLDSIGKDVLSPKGRCVEHRQKGSYGFYFGFICLSGRILDFKINSVYHFFYFLNVLFDGVGCVEIRR